MNPHHFWQEILAPADDAHAFGGFYPARFDDGRILRLPVRPLADGEHALASLIINQASFAVLDAIAADLAAKLAALAPEVIVGLPTLGLTLASAVAQKLGHARYVPLGTSRKFWYDDALCVSLSSITTPEHARRLYIDPRMLPLLQGRRVMLIDDVISSGTSIAAGISLLDLCGIAPAAIGTAMLQSERWRKRLDPSRYHLTTVLRSPILRKTPAGMWVES